MKSGVELVRNSRTGHYCIRIPIPGSKYFRNVSTGECELDRARAVVAASGADRLILLAQADALTTRTLKIVTAGRWGTCEEIYNTWLEHLAITAAQRTAEIYAQRVASFCDVLNCWKRQFSGLSERDIDSWVNSGGAHVSTASARLAAIRSIFSYAMAKGAIVANPAAIVRVNRRLMPVYQLETHAAPPITEGEYSVLLQNLEGIWRDWTILAYCCGYRLVDCATLEWASIGEQGIVIYPRKSQGRRRLMLSLNDPLIARPELQQLIGRLGIAERINDTYVWPEHCERFLSAARSNYSKNFARCLEQLGIEGKSFHCLRRACAVRLKEAGRNLDEIRQALGHATSETTMLYIEPAR